MGGGNWGGSAAGGGMSFQAAVSALCMVHMIRSMPLGWCDSIVDIPVSILAETGGAGDDICLQLNTGNTLEIQAKLRLRANSELWDSLLALCVRAAADLSFYGVLAVGPGTSQSIRVNLARDIIRLGQGRTDDLSALARTLRTKLDQVGLLASTCSRVRIHTLHLLEQDAASAQTALAHLAYISPDPERLWGFFRAEGLRLIQLRGRHDTPALVGVISRLFSDSLCLSAPAMVVSRLLDWTLKKTKEFTIPAVDSTFSLDEDWLELKAVGQDKPDWLANSLEEALTRYHEGGQNRSARHGRGQEFDAETLGYFIRHCVVIAGPGMGKTQLLRRIARLLAKKEHPVVIVSLRQLAERMRVGETFIEGVLQIGLDSSSIRPQELLSIGLQNLTLLLDGLDEAGSEQEKIAVGALALVASSPQCRIVFSTRPIGYETAVLANWRHYELLPIESSDASRSVKHLVAASGGDGNLKITAAMTAAIRCIDNSSYKFQARSPLLIALLAALAINGVAASETQAGLYEQIFKLFDRIGAKRSNVASPSPAVLKAFLHRLGWELVAHPHADLNHTLEACANHLGAELDERPLKARATCDLALAFWEAVGFVERVRFRTNESLTFVHKTFAEYAAACYLFSRDAGERQRLIVEVEPAKQWDEVLIFSSGLGLGAELISRAISNVRSDDNDAIRALRWLACSTDKIDPVLAEKLIRQAWMTIDGPNSTRSLKVGVAFVAALDKLPKDGNFLQSSPTRQQWWTELVAWACVVRRRPVELNFSMLLDFWDVYLATSEKREINRGIDLFSPVRKLWEELLVAATREAVRRGLGLEEQKFIDRLKHSLGARSMGFVGEFSYIAKEAGIKLEVEAPTSVALQLFDRGYFETARREMLALLEALDCIHPDALVNAVPPFLQLSAFLHGTDLMTMDIPAVVSVDGSSDVFARELINLAGRAVSEDYSLLISEVRAKIRQLKDPEVLSIFAGVLAVDVAADWTNCSGSDVVRLVALGLRHPSEWVVQFVANFAEQNCSAEQIAELVPSAVYDADDLGLAACAYLATRFLSTEQARELFIGRLRQPLNSGCQYLYDSLSAIWDRNSDNEVGDLVKPGLVKGPRTANATLRLVRACGFEQRKLLSPMLKDAYKYWINVEKKNEVDSRVIPPSPREDILKVLIENGITTIEELFGAAQDERSDVAGVAREALLNVLSSSESVQLELVQRIDSGEKLHALLTSFLHARFALSDSVIQSVALLLEAPSEKVRDAAFAILTNRYLSPNETAKWCDKLKLDPYQQIRDRAHDCLSASADDSSSNERPTQNADI
jgi:hypothetical protein